MSRLEPSSTPKTVNLKVVLDSAKATIPSGANIGVDRVDFDSVPVGL